MKALLINPEDRTIETVEVDGMDDIVKFIGHDTIETELVGAGGDRLFFDEECFLRGSPGRFQIDKLIPVSGKGIIVGMDGDSDRLCDAVTRAEDLRSRTIFQ